MNVAQNHPLQSGSAPAQHATGPRRSERVRRGTRSIAFRVVPKTARGNASGAGGCSRRRADPSVPLLPQGSPGYPRLTRRSPAEGEGILLQPGRFHPSSPFLPLTHSNLFLSGEISGKKLVRGSRSWDDPRTSEAQRFAEVCAAAHRPGCAAGLRSGERRAHLPEILEK